MAGRSLPLPEGNKGVQPSAIDEIRAEAPRAGSAVGELHALIAGLLSTNPAVLIP